MLTTEVREVRGAGREDQMITESEAKEGWKRKYVGLRALTIEDRKERSESITKRGDKKVWKKKW